MTRGTKYDPAGHAHALGLHLIEHPLPDGGTARYYSTERTIIIAPGLDPARRRSAIAHEVQHALAGDAGCGGSADLGEAEMAVREATARALVSIPDLAVARWMHGTEVSALAQDLDIDPGVMQDWLDLVEPTTHVA